MFKKVRSLKSLSPFVIIKQSNQIVQVTVRVGFFMTEPEKNNQLLFTQQHLANERTYLAWIRTAVAIIGIGSLSSSLHFLIGDTGRMISNILALIVGSGAAVLGVVIIVFATYSFVKKRKQIETGVFYMISFPVFTTSIFLIILAIAAVLYFIIEWQLMT